MLGSLCPPPPHIYVLVKLEAEKERERRRLAEAAEDITSPKDMIAALLHDVMR